MPPTAKCSDFGFRVLKILGGVVRGQYKIVSFFDISPKLTDYRHREAEQKKLLRSLFNLRMPKNADKDFIKVQDEYLKEEIEVNIRSYPFSIYPRSSPIIASA